MHLLRSRKKKKDKDNYVKLRSFVGFKLSSFPYVPPTSKVEEINISDTNLVSFKGMVELQNLEILRCENTKISSFLGAKPLPSLRKLFLANTPLSHYSYHRIMAVIVFGDSLETVDFINITKAERLFAINNRELLFQYLIEGWVMTITDPIKLFNVITRQRRVLFPAPVFPSPVSSPMNSPKKAKYLSAQSSPQKKHIYSPLQSQPLDVNIHKIILTLMRRLHSILFEKSGSKSIYKRSNDDFLLDKDNIENRNEEMVSSISPLLINDEAYFVLIKMILMAVNTRPLNIKEIIQFVTLFKDEKLVSFMKIQISLFGFYSYPIIADLLENLLEQNILIDDDVKPYFFSVYERFENWDSSFVLFESNHNLSVTFISFFCIFSNVIERVDGELFNNLQNQLGDNEKEIYDSFMKIHETRKSTITTLLSDDIVSYASLSESNIIQNIINYTPWSITTNVKSAAAAFAGSEYCFLQYSIKGENFNVLFETADQENLEEEDIQKQNLIDIKNEDEVLYFAVAGGNSNIILKFKHDDNDALINYVPTAIQYHRFISLNQIFTRVTNSKYLKFDDSFFDLDSDDSLEEEDSENEKNLSSLSKFSCFYLPAAENLDYCALMFFAKKRIPFDNPVLNTIISHGVPESQSNDQIIHCNAFLVHFLLNIGFCTDDCLFLSVKKQNIEVSKVIINRFDSKRYDITTDETKVIRFRAQEKRDIIKKIINFKGDDNLHWTPLQVATCIGDLQFVKLIALREETEVNEQDDEGNTALTIAVSNEFTDIVQFLLSLPKINPNLSDKKGWSPIAIAAGKNYSNIISILISNFRTNVNCKTLDEGATPLMIAVDTNNFEAFNVLISSENIDLNLKSKNNQTALSIAIEKERIPFIQAMIKTKKVDIKLGNAIQLAKQSKNEEIKEIFKHFI